jgi:XTP/dITP diphosphohydrolase
LERLVLVTHNKGKFAEASEIAKKFGIELEMPKGGDEKFEIQADTLQEVSAYSAKHAFEKLKRPLIVDDSGLFIDALRGFPGVYSAYVLPTLGNDGILRLMNGVQNRKARFECCVSYCDAGGVTSFTEMVVGNILDMKRGQNGFGFDPIFSAEGFNVTSMAEMELDQKNDISHRGKAFKAFFGWYSEKNRA